MNLSYTSKKRLRENFGRIKTSSKMPNLIEIQKNSYSNFLQHDIDATARTDSGLHAAFSSVFPISDFTGAATLEYVEYDFDPPKYDVIECQQRGISYTAPIRVTLRLIIWDIDEESDVKEIKGIKEQDVYIGDVPLMTTNGTFIINGTERVIVSQMHRSPGVFFDHDKGKTHSSGKFLYSARIIPYRGSWLDFEFDAKDLLYFRIDRKRKLLISTLLFALGLDKQEIFNTFYKNFSYKKTKHGWSAPFNFDKYKGIKLKTDLLDASNGKVVVESGSKITPRLSKKLQQEGLENVIVSSEQITGTYVANDIIDPTTGEVILSAGDEITEEKFSLLDTLDFKEIPVLLIDGVSVGPYIRNSITADKNSSKEQALIDIYKVMRPGEPPTVDASEKLFESLFFDESRYDLSIVGRVKINARLKQNNDEELRILKNEDIINIIQTLVQLKDGIGEVDDIDHLGNRRVRSVGELMENQFRIGLLRMERAIVERMNSVDIDTVMPHDLVNAKVLGAVIREFFGSSQLSQFMDQTNPLSEITHKRRLSALGPGGLTRERAGFEVRDVHATHYGRICPIETPEGPNIGLINSMATYAVINKHGFIESPYRQVSNGIVTEDIQYLSAIEEGEFTIAQANEPISNEGKFDAELISCRKGGEFVMAKPEDIHFMDVSPKQVVSVATSLIPFLENDDANRALMGSNMQRQAVPLVKADAPLVGTGMEAVVAQDSGVTVVAKQDGIVDQIDATRIVVRSTNLEKGSTSPGVEVYNLIKYQRSNQNTCINQRPLVNVGDTIKAGDIIADGPSTHIGELALGRNVLVAFMPWNGYNYEDSILISERVVQSDAFTSIHIEEFEIVARDTRLGPEEITRDIPNMGEESLRQLDEIGIVHVGAEVRSGDILVGKVTPKSESPMTPEEKLLRAIFGEKASDVRDTSLRLSPGITGTVVEVRVFSRRGIDKDERALSNERMEIERMTKDRDDELAIIENFIYMRLHELLLNNILVMGPKGTEAGTKITDELLSDYRKRLWWQFTVEDEKITTEIEEFRAQLDNVKDRLDKALSSKIEKLQSGDDLPQGALKVVKVFVAVKHRLQPGDKMAGRHGNKGVISKINAVEDMPYLEDGTPVDIVLNPLGVPSRMNIGQILETHLGWASAKLGEQISDLLKNIANQTNTVDDLRSRMLEIYESDESCEALRTMDADALIELAGNLRRGVPFATPVFDGAKEEDVVRMLEKAGLKGSGQSTLFDGRTGEQFDREVTVGYIYMLKLHHLVDDKMHARSVGPYSLVTQQPLGGKSHFGGQRFGEMECWALQAYGSSYTLQEMLTVKSDDVAGRIKIYESIVKGDQNFECGIPESFNVMVKELRSLCLNMELVTNEDSAAA